MQIAIVIEGLVQNFNLILVKVIDEGNFFMGLWMESNHTKKFNKKTKDKKCVVIEKIDAIHPYYRTILWI